MRCHWEKVCLKLSHKSFLCINSVVISLFGAERNGSSAKGDKLRYSPSHHHSDHSGLPTLEDQKCSDPDAPPNERNELAATPERREEAEQCGPTMIVDGTDVTICAENTANLVGDIFLVIMFFRLTISRLSKSSKNRICRLLYILVRLNYWMRQCTVLNRISPYWVPKGTCRN